MHMSEVEGHQTPPFILNFFSSTWDAWMLGDSNFSGVFTSWGDPKYSHLEFIIVTFLLLDPQSPALHCLAFLMDTEYHHISASPSFLPSCPFHPLLDCNHSCLPHSHCDSASTFSVRKWQPCPSQKSWKLARTTELSLKVQGFHKHPEFLSEEKKKCLILIVCCTERKRDSLIWLSSQKPKEKDHETFTYNVNVMCFFYFLCSYTWSSRYCSDSSGRSSFLCTSHSFDLLTSPQHL